MSKFSLPTQKKGVKEPVPVDTEALEAFAAGAKERSNKDPLEPPWEQHDQDTPPRYNVSVRLNDYHIEMLRYLAKIQDTSQQKILRKHVLPVIEELAERAFKENTSK